MMISINFIDKTIVMDGKSDIYDAPFKPINLTAIQWNGTKGHFEFAKGAQIPFDNVELIQPYIAKYIADRKTEAKPEQILANATVIAKAEAELVK